MPYIHHALYLKNTKWVGLDLLHKVTNTKYLQSSILLCKVDFVTSQHEGVAQGYIIKTKLKQMVEQAKEKEKEDQSPEYMYGARGPPWNWFIKKIPKKM